MILVISHLETPVGYSELCQTSKMELFSEILNGF